MTYRVFYTHTVRDHISGQVAYLQDQGVSSQTIDDWFNRLFDAIDSLYDWPLRYPVAEHESAARGMEIRKLTFGDYLIYYRVDESEKLVHVLSFRHAARDNDEG